MRPEEAKPSRPPADARRAFARARDAVAAALFRAGVEGRDVSGVRVELVHPEMALVVQGLARAIARAARHPEASLVPGGGWSGGPFPARHAYVTAWELEAIGGLRAAEVERTLPAGADAPIRVSEGGPGGTAEAFSPWLVHSFGGRKQHARPEVAALVPASARTVLDVGCGEGALGASLEERGARVTGIELDASAAAVAERRLTRVLSCPAEEAMGLLDVRPDVVVLADVLEHLEAPVEVLRALRRALAPGGSLVFSLPNATHAAVLGGAFRGRWDRELEGVVADDHRTYAGRAGWTALLSSCGFRVTTLRPVLAPTPLSEGDRASFLLSSALGAEDLDAVQWLGTAEAAPIPAGPEPGRPTAPDAGPLTSEDPVAAVRALAATGPLTLRPANALHAPAVELLLGGGLVAGLAARGLLCGWTPAGLARRFEGSGVTVRFASPRYETLPAGVRKAVAARREAGLPTDAETLEAAEWETTFGLPGA